MRVAAIAHSPWLGGAERCLLELVAEVARRPGHEVHVLLPQSGEMRERLEAAGARTRIVPARWWARDPGTRRRGLDLAGIRRTGGALRALEPDVVLSNTMVHPPGAFAARALGLPHLWWIHELGARDHGFRFLLGQRGTVRAIGALSDAVLVSAPVVREQLLHDGLDPAGLRHVPYAVAAPIATVPPTGRAPARPGLVIAGRVRPSKGQADAVAALTHLPHATLDVVGSGAPEDIAALERLARSLGVAGRVTFHGGVPDPTALVDRATVALVCSRDEAFGRVTVEAMKRGRPVVGAAAGGTERLIEDGVTGRLYPPGDPAGLAAAVGELLADDAARARIARAGWAWATETFTTERQADAFLAAAQAVRAARRRR